MVIGALAPLGCRQAGPELGGSRVASFAGAVRLHTTFYKDPVSKRESTLYHVLFVPEWKVPEGGGFGTMGSAGSLIGDTISHDYSYEEFGGLSVKSGPVRIVNAKTLEAAGRKYDLGSGSVFVAHVRTDGALRITQLSPRHEDSSPEGVLAFIKSSMPGDSHVQEIRAQR